MDRRITTVHENSLPSEDIPDPGQNNFLNHAMIDTQTLSSLLTLRLDSTPYLNPSATELLNALCACPKLESLTLLDIYLSEGSQLSKYPLAILRELRSITINNITPQGVACDVFSNLEIPSCLTFDFDLDYQSLSGPLSNALLTLVTPACQEALQLAENATLTFFKGYMKIESSFNLFRDREFQISLMEVRASNVVNEWLVPVILDRIWSGERPSLYCCFTDLGGLDVADIKKILQNLPQIRSLKFIGCDKGIDEMVAALATPQGEGGFHGWICPGLYNLSFLGCIYTQPRSFVNLVNNRLSNPFPDADTPEPLGTFVLQEGSVSHTMTPELFEEIARLLVEGNAEWRDASGNNLRRAALRTNGASGQPSGSRRAGLRRRDPSSSAPSVEIDAGHRPITVRGKTAFVVHPPPKTLTRKTWTVADRNALDAAVVTYKQQNNLTDQQFTNLLIVKGNDAAKEIHTIMVHAHPPSGIRTLQGLNKILRKKWVPKFLASEAGGRSSWPTTREGG
ncbi:hypothetical protein FRB94_004031 [Tulasnella sp. JGI-2019a]|nr:hypothetical protein FRB94_004031 [Tulasnella sp. JGI-2019a]